jgi:site-specific DNA recombinase
VRQVVAEVVRDPRVAAAMEPGSDGLAADKARRQVLVTSLEQTEMDYDGDLIDARRFKAKSDRITGEIAEIDERLTSGIQRSLSSKVLRAPAPGAAFTNAPVDIQRAVLRSVLTVTVRPTTARGMKWSSGRLRIAPVHPTAGRDTLGTVVK